MALDRPKFEQGEVAILQTTTHPHLNGEVIVHHVMELIDGKKIYHPDYPGKVFFTKVLVDKFVYDVGYRNEQDYPIFCDERELRKKHKPSEFSFDDLMANLNSKIQEPVR